MLARNVLLPCLVASCLLLADLTRAQIDSPPEYSVKAAFLYKIALYVQWPEDAFETEESPVLVGVVGPQWMLDQVEAAVRARTLADRPVRVTRVVNQDISDFHVLFILRSEERRLTRRPASSDRPVLVVTESSNWQELGSVVNFVLLDDRVRFDVDLASAERRGLILSSQLLNVARNVLGKP